MRKFVLFLAVVSLWARAAWAATPPFPYDPGATLCLLLDDETAVDLVEGTGSRAGLYTASNASLIGESVGVGWRYARVYAGTTALDVDPTSSWLIGSIVFYFDGTAVIQAPPLTATGVWAHGTRTVTSAANITSNGATINQTHLAKLDVPGTLANSAAAETYRADTSNLAQASALADVMDYVTDVLDGLDELGDAIADLDAGNLTGEDIRLAVGLTNADLDSKFAALPTDVLNAPWSPTPAEDTLAEQLAIISSLAGGANSQAAAAVSGIGDLSDALEIVSGRVVLALPAAAPGSSGGLPRTQDVGEGGGGQPRINYPPAQAYLLDVSARNDGTHTTNKPVRIRVGELPAVGIRMQRLYGGVYVASVGEPTVSPGSELSAEALGPRDNVAMVQLGGVPEAGELYVVTVPVTMATGGVGETVMVTFEVQVFSQ